MKVLEYTVRFVTPAFLGDAEQNGRWRTPPFKAMLRQWWRVAYAADRGFRVSLGEMRREEGLFFGHAWLEDDRDERGQKVAARKSLVRVRLSTWAKGQLGNWRSPDATVTHPEVERSVGSQLYLGYGPLVSRGGTALKANAAIQAGESATLSIAVSEEHAAKLQHALWLMDRYGTVGGRSRNGWGSFALLPSDELGAAEPPLRAWQECLGCDWPHAIGRDAKGALIWQTQPFDDWRALMKRLAEIKIGLRTQFAFPNRQPDGEVHERHWLSYPVTKHSVRAWDKEKLRLPNTLRFKLRATANGQLVGVIFHVPHLPPKNFRPNRQDIESVWTHVHRFLDRSAQALTRIPA